MNIEQGILKYFFCVKLCKSNFYPNLLYFIIRYFLFIIWTLDIGELGNSVLGIPIAIGIFINLL